MCFQEVYSALFLVLHITILHILIIFDVLHLLTVIDLCCYILDNAGRCI